LGYFAQRTLPGGSKDLWDEVIEIQMKSVF
jgi:hypothetical protein